ncbi:hypothetical protein LINGRAHAP2_LOCUS9051 [Linum grandiflorum]
MNIVGIAEFSTTNIWIQIIPFEISCFVLRCFVGQIVTLDNLKKKGWVLANHCCLRRRQEEKSDELHDVMNQGQ